MDRFVDEAIKKAMKTRQFPCPKPFATHQECVEEMSGEVDDPDAFCAEWARACGEESNTMPVEQIERRAFVVPELRAKPESRVIEGHAAVFNRMSEDLGGFREQIASGAFAQSIANDDVVALWNHDANHVLARNRSGSLRLGEDDRGLSVEIDAIQAQWADDLLASIRRGDVSGMSFGFITQEDSWDMVDGVNLRTLRRVRLLDVSPVTFPAYPQTDLSVAKRSLQSWWEEQRQEQVNLELMAAEREQSMSLTKQKI